MKGGRSIAGEGPFDQFFSLWLALVSCARPKLQPQDYDKMDTDRCTALSLAKEAPETIFRELDSCKEDLGKFVAEYANIAKRIGRSPQEAFDVSIDLIARAVEAYREGIISPSPTRRPEKSSNSGLRSMSCSPPEG